MGAGVELLDRIALGVSDYTEERHRAIQKTTLNWGKDTTATDKALRNCVFGSALSVIEGLRVKRTDERDAITLLGTAGFSGYAIGRGLLGSESARPSYSQSPADERDNAYPNPRAIGDVEPRQSGGSLLGVRVSDEHGADRGKLLAVWQDRRAQKVQAASVGVVGQQRGLCNGRGGSVRTVRWARRLTLAGFGGVVAVLPNRRLVDHLDKLLECWRTSRAIRSGVHPARQPEGGRGRGEGISPVDPDRWRAGELMTVRVLSRFDLAMLNPGRDAREIKGRSQTLFGHDPVGASIEIQQLHLHRHHPVLRPATRPRSPSPCDGVTLLPRLE